MLYRRRFEFLKGLAGLPYTHYEALGLIKATRINVDVAYRLLDRMLAAYDAMVHPDEIRKQLDRAESEKQRLYNNVRPLIERQQEHKRKINRLFVRLIQGEDITAALKQMVSGNERGYKQSGSIDMWKAKREECERLGEAKIYSQDPSFLPSAMERYGKWRGNIQIYRTARDRGLLHVPISQSERIQSGCMQLEKELYELEKREAEVFRSVGLKRLDEIKSGA